MTYNIAAMMLCFLFCLDILIYSNPDMIEVLFYYIITFRKPTLYHVNFLFYAHWFCRIMRQFVQGTRATTDLKPLKFKERERG
jgi:hypothetical protein